MGKFPYKVFAHKGSARALPYGVAPTPTSNSFAMLAKDEISPTMSVDGLCTPPSKPRLVEGLERSTLLSSVGKTTHTHVPLIQTPPDACTPGKGEARRHVNSMRITRAKAKLAKPGKRGRPKGAKDRKPRKPRGSKTQKPNKVVDVSGRVAQVASEGGFAGTQRQLDFGALERNARPKAPPARLRPRAHESATDGEGVRCEPDMDERGTCQPDSEHAT